MSEPLSLALPSELVEAIVDRVAERVLEQLGNGSPWLTREAAAKYLGLPVSRLEKDAAKQKGKKAANAIPCHRDGRRVLYHREELDAYLSRTFDKPSDAV